jgi:hypothetical protein
MRVSTLFYMMKSERGFTKKERTVSSCEDEER